MRRVAGVWWKVALGAVTVVGQAPMGEASAQAVGAPPGFEQILTATDACLVRQYEALLATENVHLDFKPDGIRRLAEIAFAVNEKQENIGARRLYTVMERLLDDLSFHATRHTGETFAIDAAYVDTRLEGIAGDENLARYIL